MQRKIGEMYKEVKVRREVSGEMREPVGEITEEVTLNVSVHTTSTGSSMLSDNSTSDPQSSSSSQSEPTNQHGSYPRRHRNDDFAAHRNRADHRDRGNPRNYDDCVGNQEVDMAELEAILRRVDRDSPSKGGMVNVCRSSHGGSSVGVTHNTEMSSGTWSDKMENTTALNVALKEIARVSEELCSYQDEISRKSGGDKRGRTESSYFPEVDHVTTRERMEDPAFNLTQLVADLRALEEENWLSIRNDPARGPSHLKEPTRGPSHLKDPDRGSSHLRDPDRGPSHLKEPTRGPSHLKDPDRGPSHLKEPTRGPSHLKDPDRGPSHLKDPDRGPSHLKNPARGPSHLKDPTSKPSEREREAPPLPPLLVPPPIPPRTTSWYLASPSPELQLHVPESLSGSGRKCHSPCLLLDRKCSSSPSIVRKFEAMLQENEGKVLTEAGFTTCAVPFNSHCNAGCCHNRWSFGSSKSSTYVPVQKSLSEVNIVSAAGKDLIHDYRPVEKPRSPRSPERESHIQPGNKDLAVSHICLDLTLELPPPGSNPPGSNPPGSNPPGSNPPGSNPPDSNPPDSNPPGSNPPDSNPPGHSRNMMLEQATAEFNRTLFQAEMGRGMEDDEVEDSFTSAGVSKRGVPDGTTVCGEVTHGVTRETNIDLPPRHTTEVRQKEVIFDITAQKLSSGIKLSQALPPSDPHPGVTVRTFDPPATSDLSPQRPEVAFKNMPSNPATRCPEVKHKAGPPNSLSTPTLHRSISSEYKQPAQTTHTAPGPEVSASPKRDIKAQGARPHSVKSCPAPQPPTYFRPRQVGQPGCRSTTTQDILKTGSGGSGLCVPGGSGLCVPGGSGLCVPGGSGLCVPGGSGLCVPGGSGLRVPGGSGLRVPGGSGLCVPGGSGLRVPGGSGLRVPGGSGLRVPGGSGLRVPGGSGLRGVMSDQPWKPLTLAALRPSDSRSNYGAVERILKSYENTAWSQRYQNHTQPTESSPNAGPSLRPDPGPSLSPSPNPGLSPSPNPGLSPSPNPGLSPSPNPGLSPSPNPGLSPSPNPGLSPRLSPSPNPGLSPSPNPGLSPSPNPGPSPRQEEELMDLLEEMMDKDYWDQSGPASGHSSHTHSHHSQLTSSHRETRLTMQECKVSSSSSSVQKNFSRPACPANRRPPSRWASCSPSTSSSSTSSFSSTPINQPSSGSAHKHTSFSYSAYHTETVII
ncbi:nascent polypeptide-associated complex subunit alpha, muscle-specific form isoform X2 [Oncorhynchus kisutch]|nr:nascent polypeptide-associated complex subunit alpha, muscle-specific form isoform X2 [Oncorhynchus kisutch]